ncbi:hypothetical protein T492DRAFT_888719, partial [Pavlovales sp. CCMP2436]
YGSSNDHFGYKRCASAVQAAKKALVDAGNVYKKTKQWPIALEFATKAILIAEDMPGWIQESDNGAKKAAIKFLKELKAEAEKHTA